MTPYRERLLPTWWVWLVALAFVATLAVAYGAALGPRAGIVVGVAGLVLVVWLLLITSPQIRIDSQGIAVGGAHLPPAAIGGARVLEPAELRDRSGPLADARVYTALRPLSGRWGVWVDLADPEDPHPAWAFTSRHPARAVEAITGTM
jgi:hypothetical protein